MQDDSALADLWLDPAVAAAWNATDRADHYLVAADIWRVAGNPVSEQKALAALLHEQPQHPSAGPRLLEVLAVLQDENGFAAQVHRLQQNAGSAAARAALAVPAADFWVNNFHDNDAAVQMLRDSFAEFIDPTVLAALRKLMTDLGRQQGFVTLLQERAARAAAGDKLLLLRTAAAVAQEMKAPDDAFALYRQILAIVPDDREASDFAVKHARQTGDMAQVMALLEARAQAATNPADISHALTEAAQIARDALHDAAAERRILETACERAPTDLLGTRLVELLLAEGDIAAAVDRLVDGPVDARAARVLAQQLAAKVAAGAADAATGEVLLHWLNEHHPDTAEAVTYRLTRARAQGDHAAVLDALTSRLAVADGLSPADIAQLHNDAGDAADTLQQPAVAVDHWLKAAATGSVHLDVLLRAQRVAQDAADSALMQQVIAQTAHQLPAVHALVDKLTDAMRRRWLVLVGQAHELLDQPPGAIAAYEDLLRLTPGALPPVVVTGLTSMYKQAQAWEKLAELYRHLAEAAVSPDARAQHLTALGFLYRDALADADKACHYFAQSLDVQPLYGPAQLAYGMLLAQKNRWDQALPLLQGTIDVTDAQTPMEHLLTLAQGYRQTGSTAEAIDLTGAILARAPRNRDVQLARAQMLQDAGHLADAEIAWQDYLTLLGDDADPALVAQAHMHVAQIAQVLGHDAQTVAALEAADRLAPDQEATLAALRTAYERAERWSDVANICLRQATLSDPLMQPQFYRALVHVYDDKLHDGERAVHMLEHLSELAPRDTGVLTELLARYATPDAAPKFLLTAERLLALAPEDDLDVDFFVKLAGAYESVDTARARELYTKALARAPSRTDVLDKTRAMALQANDFAAYAPAEEDALAAVQDPEEKSQRYAALAEIYVKHLGQLDQAVAALGKACALQPANEALWRSLADCYALDEKYYDKAVELYRRLLAASPLNTDILRLLARLLGQAGDTDKAYCYYALLATISPSDSEARRFIDACRAARPVAAQRGLTDADRNQSLQHPHQAGPIEDLFAPLARFAELTQPGDLSKRGVEERDRWAPGDAHVRALLPVLESLGLPQAALYPWKTGGFACEVELVGQPALLLGNSLFDAGLDRQRTFLVARAAELYRSGHTLCDRLSGPDLQSLLAALCMAVDPGHERYPGARPDSTRLSQVVGTPMTPQIRIAMKARVTGYVKKAASLDVNRWRMAATSTANRVAMMVSCDIEEAITALLRSRGFEDTESARAPVLQEAPDLLDLYRFAQSEAYFELRQVLGLALRRSR